MKLEQFKKRAKKMPNTPGVYYFLGPKKHVLYIGKATSLRARVRSYFSKDLEKTRGPLLSQMIQDATSVAWRQTDSVLEALILEANLVHSYQPKANSALKDDKSFNYVVITDEDFPRILIVRGRDIASQAKDFAKARHRFGPFPHGGQLKEALKIIRKIFPFRDTCNTLGEGGTGKPCFNAQLGLCPGVCAGTISKNEYRKNIKRIVLFFQGKKKTLLRQLLRDMKELAQREKFEEAGKARKQVFALTHIQDVSLIKEEYRSPEPLSLAKRGSRIEAYDVAHLGGRASVGVMTVVEDDTAQKSEYRKFRIKSAKGGDDVGALKEVVSRRLGHDEWPMPRLIVVDGSAAQINAAENVLHTYGVHIPVVGVVKDQKHRPREIRGDRLQIGGRERAILLANAEAHRFAISYHRKRSRRLFI